MKRYATRLRVRLSMLAAMLAFSVDARSPNPVTNSTLTVDAVVGARPARRFIRDRLGWLRRRSRTGFGDKRPRAVHRRELNRHKALRPLGRGRRDKRAAIGQRAEALARDEGWRGGRSSGPQRKGFDAGRAQGEAQVRRRQRLRRLKIAFERLRLDHSAATAIAERD